MRRGIDERGEIAAWLIRSRALFREPGAKRAWTVDQFLDALKAETGWAPVRTTYARWESGAARPEPDNLQRVVDFYAARDVAGPEGPKVELPPVTAGIPELVAALAAQTTAINALVARLGSLADGSIASAVRQAVAEAGLDLGDGDSREAPPPAPSL